MPDEKEIKYRLQPGQIDRIARILAAAPHERVRLIDRYYDVKDRTVRLRWVDGKPRLTLKGAARWEGPTKIRAEWEEALADGQDRVIDRLMAFLGHGVRAEIPKARTSWRLEGVEVAHDRLDGIDVDFLEIEGEHDAIARMAAKLGLGPDQVERRSYLAIWADRAQGP